MSRFVLTSPLLGFFSHFLFGFNSSCLRIFGERDFTCRSFLRKRELGLASILLHMICRLTMQSPKVLLLGQTAYCTYSTITYS
jgi:hypothetical protein